MKVSPRSGAPKAVGRRSLSRARRHLEAPTRRRTKPWKTSPRIRSQAGEEASTATDKDIRQAESVLPWPFKATQHALEEWTHFFGRATERNFRATDDLSECHSITGLLQWQGNLIQSNVEDWLQTSFSVFSVSARKFFSYQTQ